MLYQEINLPIWAELLIMAILSIVIIFSDKVRATRKGGGKADTER